MHFTEKIELHVLHFIIFHLYLYFLLFFSTLINLLITSELYNTLLLLLPLLRGDS